MDNSWSLSVNNSAYPTLLREIYNPPERLYYKGKLEVLNKQCVAVVGTRRNTEYGEFATRKIIEELAVLDVAIVSGLAKGIDTIAHKAALKNGMPTIAVLGSGINNIYPEVNRNLAEEISMDGLILSEYEDMTAPIDFQFPQRNRIISGLSIAVIVIEAPEKSGALITAKLALDQNREIFTIPGDIDRETSQGPLKLLQTCGAYPISSGREIIEILQKQPPLFNPKIQNKSTINLAMKTPIKIPIKPRTAHATHHLNKPKTTPILPEYNMTPSKKLIFSILSKNRPKSLETIKEKTSFDTAKILCELSFLEIKKLIVPKDGGYLRVV